MQPRGERRITPELVESLPDADKCILSVLPGQAFVSHHPEAETEHPVHVLIVEGPERDLISVPRPLYQIIVVQSKSSVDRR